MRRGIAAAFAAVVLLGAAPPSARGSAPGGLQTALVHRYLAALAAQRYTDAFALLDPAGRAYFRTPANFASTFQADGFALRSYAIVDSKERGRVRTYVVRETVRLNDPARDAAGAATIDVTYGVIGPASNARVLDLGRPWRSYAVRAVSEAGALRVAVKKVSFYSTRISVVITVANVGSGFVTVLPYGRSALRDERGNVYRPEKTDSARRAAQPLALGIHLAPNEQLTGALDFDVPRIDARARSYALTLAPNVRDGADAPFGVDVAHIEIPA